jgi:hypothetical protein
MKYAFLSLWLYGLVGCSSLPQIAGTSIPQLLVQYPLPEIPTSVQKPPLEIYLALLINKDGSVAKVRFIDGSGSITWDSLAAITIKRWQFLPARINDQPVSTWFHLRAPLRYRKPLYLYLAKIECATIERADSVYKALEHGQDFNDLASRYSIDSSYTNRGVLGVVNIYCYPQNIRQYLFLLQIDEFTKPLKYGDQYIIFKRMKD